MNDEQEPKWEEVTNADAVDWIDTQRLAVPGGWLNRVPCAGLSYTGQSVGRATFVQWGEGGEASPSPASAVQAIDAATARRISACLRPMSWLLRLAAAWATVGRS